MAISLDDEQESQVTQSLNAKSTELQGHSGSLIVRLARLAWLGWILFFIMLVAFILQGFLNSLSTPVMATENGRIIGEVVYNEPYIRDRMQIQRAVKVWTESYLVSNASTLDEDMSIALSHTCPDLQTQLIKEWEATDHYYQVKSQQLRTKVFWAQEEPIQLLKVRDFDYEAKIRGEVLNLDTNTSARFDLRVVFRLVKRSLSNSLGIEVCGARDLPQ